MDDLLPWLGALLVLTAVLDVFYTVLYPASGAGPVRKPLSRGVWGAFRGIGRRLPRRARVKLLSYAGPVLITLTITVWFLMLTTGWAMIYKGALGSGIRASSGPTDTGWATAIYFSGFNLTTLGVGDIAPASALYRVLTVLQSALGFAFFSMATTYALSVYSTLSGRNAFLQGVDDLSRRTGDAAELLPRLLANGDLASAGSRLSSWAAELRQIEQTVRLYPVLAYFHYHAPSRALPPVVRLALDSVALLRSTLDAGRHAGLLKSPALDELSQAALSLTEALLPAARLRHAPPSAREVRDWQARYRDVRARLAETGLAPGADAEAGAGRYVELRSLWSSQVQGLADEMLYEWDAPEPGLDERDRASPG